VVVTGGVVVTDGVVMTVVDFAASRSLGFVVTRVDAVVVVGVATGTVTGMENSANAESESLARTCACEVVVP
jgi:hypothetical protein